MINNRSCRALVLLSSLAWIGCGGEEGPRKYDVTGKVTHRGQPILVGDMVLEPTEGPANSQTVTGAAIAEGEYSARIVGGPHRISVRDLTGNPDAIGGEEYENARPRFFKQYAGTVEFPRIDTVEEGETVTHDIEIPASHR